MNDNQPKPVRIKPSFEHLEFTKEIKAVMVKYKNRITPVEMLALTAYMTGQLTALQDNQVTPEMCMNMVAQNMARGNKEAIDNLIASEGKSW